MENHGQPKVSADTCIRIKEGSFFQRAESAAERNVREWIRKTLREVFLQAFQRHLQFDNNDNAAKLSAEDLDKCMELVQRVSDAWQEELCQNKHLRTAAWVQDVWDSGRGNLWSVELTVDGWKERTILSHKGAPTASATSSVPVQVETDPIADLGTDVGGISSGDGDLLKVPYCQLRKLGRHTTCKIEEGNQDSNVIAELQRLGQHKQSYWPLDHQIVEDTAKTIPKRQRWEKRRPSNSMNYQVVVNDDNEEEKEGEFLENTTAHRILSAVLERAKSKIKNPRQGNKRKRGRPTTAIAAQPEETPRLPSTVASSRHNVDEELTTQEKEELDRLIHPDDGDPDGRSMICIFGALQDIGKIHASIQRERKQSQGISTNLTEKQRRRQERAYIKERLAPHRIQKNQDPQKYRSKVLRTEQECEDGITKNFLEFDLGWSLLEYDEGGEKRLMAFSSIQASLEEQSPAGASKSSAPGDESQSDATT
jgi:hypothetical protein